MSVAFKPTKPLVLGCQLLLTLCAVASVALAQSTDINLPSPISTNEVVGSIAARDLGDSRRTDHFYAFVGNPGDVLITVKSNNLNGDVDVFTAGSLRPLLKFALYAESTSPITKSIYLRRRTDLVLRVEARSPNDDEGIYQIRLGGSFEPIVSEGLLAAAEDPAADSSGTTPAQRDKNIRRVSSVGARIPEPPPPVEEVAVATPTPEMTPEPTPESTPEPTPAETPATIATPEPPAAEAPAPTPRRRTRGRTPAGRRRPASRPAPTDEKAATTETENKTKPAEPPESEAAAPTPGKRTAKSDSTPPATESQEPETPTGPRLIIELLDGTRIERFMSTIRRVTIENNQIVVVNRLGRIERVRMSDVVRMSIEP